MPKGVYKRPPGYFPFKRSDRPPEPHFRVHWRAQNRAGTRCGTPIPAWSRDATDVPQMVTCGSCRRLLAFDFG